MVDKIEAFFDLRLLFLCLLLRWAQDYLPLQIACFAYSHFLELSKQPSILKQKSSNPIIMIGEKDIFASLAEHYSFGILLLFDYICSQKE